MGEPQMNQNLDVLKTEIRDYLEAAHFNVYYGYSRMLDTLPVVFWDVERYPDYKMFLRTAEGTEVKLIVLHSREFSVDLVDDAVERLPVAGFDRDEQRNVERKLRDMRVYDGFTCAIELSFDLQGRAYIFSLHTDWYDEFSDLLEDIDDAIADEQDDDDDEGPIGGYFSKN
jgi:hypothetical protein